LRKDTEYRRLRIVHLLHSFGTGGWKNAAQGAQTGCGAHLELGRAVAQVARSMPDIRLMVIGVGPERQKLETMADMAAGRWRQPMPAVSNPL
jgi:hypothetical protein